jgi:hypothetical protein
MSPSPRPPLRPPEVSRASGGQPLRRRTTTAFVIRRSPELTIGSATSESSWSGPYARRQPTMTRLAERAELPKYLGIASVGAARLKVSQSAINAAQSAPARTSAFRQERPTSTGFWFVDEPLAGSSPIATAADGRGRPGARTPTTTHGPQLLAPLTSAFIAVSDALPGGFA